MSIEMILLRLDAAGFRILSALLSVLWQSSILLAAAGALAYFLRNRSAAARHAVWVAAVLAIPLLPMLSPEEARWSPVSEIPVIPAYEAPRSANPPAVTAGRAPVVSAPEAKVSAAPPSASVSTPPAPFPAPRRSIGDYP